MKPTSAFAALVALVMVHGIPVEVQYGIAKLLSSIRWLTDILAERSRHPPEVQPSQQAEGCCCGKRINRFATRPRGAQYVRFRTPSAAARWHRTRAAASLPRRTSSPEPTPALLRAPSTARVRKTLSLLVRWELSFLSLCLVLMRIVTGPGGADRGSVNPGPPPS